MNIIKILSNTANTQNTHWLNKDYGIRSNEEFSKYAVSSQLGKIKNTLLTIFRESMCTIEAAIKNYILFPFFASNNYKNLTAEKTNKIALAVFFESLNGKPADWNDYISKFQTISKDVPEFDVELFAPGVPKSGHCTLEDPELKTIYEKICQWADHNPGKPIVFFGHSNGTRVSLYLEQLLRARAPKTPVYLSFAGGVLFGTSLIQAFTKKISSWLLYKFTFGFMTPIVCKELALGSASSKDLLEKARLPLNDGVAQRYYRKYSAIQDACVIEHGSSLPILNVNGTQSGKKEKDYLVPGNGHVSLLNSLVSEQVEKAFHWINKSNGVVDTKLRYRLNNDVHVLKNRALGIVEIKDHRSLITKVQNVARAVLNHVKTGLLKIKRRTAAACSNDKSPADLLQALPWSASNDSKGLYLFIHGLRGHPTDWNSYQEEIKRKDPHAHLFAPQVPLEGNCALATAANPLLEVVSNYLKKFPGLPVTLMGTSNGGRIASCIESKLDPELLGTSRLSIVSIAGVHNGTKVVDLIKKLRLLPLAKLNNDLAEEFAFGSRVAQENLSAWQNKQYVWKYQNRSVRHLFCATTEDEQVRDLTSSLPYEGTMNSVYKVFNGHSHTSIVEGARADVMKWLSI